MRFILTCLLMTHLFAYDAKIVAVVGDKAITERDLDDRIRLVLFTSNQKSKEPAKMRPQVLESMISENLQLIAAKEGGVKVSEKEVNDSFVQIAKQNDKTIEQFKAFLEKNNINISSLKHRLKAQLAWDIVVNHGLGNVNISETEIDRVQAEEAGTIYDVSEISLYADDASKKNKIKEQAQNILTQLNAGASFTVLAQQFSQSMTAQDGGKLGRLSENQLDASLKNALSSMKPGDTRLIEMPKGYQIVHLNSISQGNNASTNVVSFKIAILPFDESMPEEEQFKVQDTIDRFQNAQSLSVFLRLAQSEKLSIQAVQDADLDAISPQEFANMLKQAKVGTVLKPIRSQEGLQIIFVEKKGIKKVEPLSRKEIKHQLEYEKKSKMAALFLNKLRARTYIKNML